MIPWHVPRMHGFWNIVSKMNKQESILKMIVQLHSPNRNYHLDKLVELNMVILLHSNPNFLLDISY